MAYELTYGLIPDGLLVCHRCDNPPCCNPAHLFLGDARDNVTDAMLKGRLAYGDRNGARVKPQNLARGKNNSQSKLTAAAVLDIRSYGPARIPFQALAAQYGVTRHAIWHAATGKTWAWVKDTTKAAEVRR